MKTKNPQHQMPINDIEYAWTEDRIVILEDGRRKAFTLYMGKCFCGRLFEGQDSIDVSRQYLEHVNAVE